MLSVRIKTNFIQSILKIDENCHHLKKDVSNVFLGSFKMKIQTKVRYILIKKEISLLS